MLMNEKGILTDELIAVWSKQAEQVYQDRLKKNKNSEHKVQLMVEETLVCFRESYGTDTPCLIQCHKSGNSLRFDISQVGEQKNPLNDDGDYLSMEIMQSLDLEPKYTYRAKRKLNTVSIPIQLPPKKNGMLINLAIAIALAILTKLILDLMPAWVGAEYVHPVITELFTKITTLFAGVATPLVFCAVINGIGGLGDVASFGKMGGKLLSRMMITYLLAVLFMLATGSAMGLAVFRAGSSGNNVVVELLHLVLDMIPGNILMPFTIDNDLQVIVLAIFIGVIMLGLGEKVGRVRNLIVEVGDLVNKMMMVICKLLPLFVYLGIADLILGDNLSNVYKISQIFIMTIIACSLLILLTCIRTKIVTGQSWRKILEPQLPSLIINLTTSSQVAALPETIKCCRDKYCIDQKMVDFGIPLGIVIYMPNGAIFLGSMVWCLTVMENGPVDFTTALIIAVVSMVVAIAAPPIPGSAFAVMPILFSACGTPLTVMPLAVIVASTLGYLLPAMNGFCLQHELFMAAWRSDMVDKDRMIQQ